MLHNGEQAYPVMLQTIEQAEKYIFLASYILETNETGRKFIDALGRAAGRGVDVRVLIDGVGELYSLPLAGWLLKKCGVRHVRFLPPRLFPPSMFINLRNHRKILVADGREGYAGGMNIGDRYLTANVRNHKRVADVHFKFTGPVVSQMEEIFLEDWGFSTGEHVQPLPQIPAIADGGAAVCRAIADGPDEDLDKLATILLGAIVAAQQEILIMTPYFLPSREMISALQVAALRGVTVHIILPARNNQPFVHWATRNMLWQLLRHKIRIYYQPPPFAHAKLLVIDSQYSLIGSANIDPRSLRLNFEFAVEICDERFGASLAAYFEEIRKQSRETSLAEMDKRPLLVRIRDALAWLFSPYL
jgi:cardiolipin synthase